jgi:hypothetical protein
VDDTEKSVSWFRKSVKTGLIAGGIVGIITGIVYGYTFVFPEEWLTAAEVMCGCVLGGLAGGCAAGAVVGRVFDEGRVAGFFKGLVGESIDGRLKVGGIVGGIVGFVVGCLVIGYLMCIASGLRNTLENWFRWFIKSLFHLFYGYYDFIFTASLFCSTILGGAAGGCLAGVVAGRMKNERRGIFMCVVCGVMGAIGGVIINFVWQFWQYF